jgi:hypothetical protein
MPGQHGSSLKDYTQALTIQLRLRNVPGARIGQVIGEVESQVRETGEDPSRRSVSRAATRSCSPAVVGRSGVGGGCPHLTLRSRRPWSAPSCC